jgi:hypothetical protein
MGTLRQTTGVTSFFFNQSDGTDGDDEDDVRTVRRGSGVGEEAAFMLLLPIRDFTSRDESMYNKSKVWDECSARRRRMCIRWHGSDAVIGVSFRKTDLSLCECVCMCLFAVSGDEQRNCGTAAVNRRSLLFLADFANRRQSLPLFQDERQKSESTDFLPVFEEGFRGHDFFFHTQTHSFTFQSAHSHRDFLFSPASTD